MNITLKLADRRQLEEEKQPSQFFIYAIKKYKKFAPVYLRYFPFSPDEGDANDGSQNSINVGCLDPYTQSLYRCLVVRPKDQSFDVIPSKKRTVKLVVYSFCLKQGDKSIGYSELR